LRVPQNVITQKYPVQGRAYRVVPRHTFVQN